jgi:acyl carrier protein
MTATSLDAASVLSVVRAELAVAAPDVPADAPADADLKYDLAVDSLSILELVARLEYHYSVTVPDDDWARLNSLNAIVDYVIAAHGSPQ